MAIVADAQFPRGLRSFIASLDVESSAEETFALLCAVEKWPVWLSFVRSARCGEKPAALSLGS